MDTDKEKDLTGLLTGWQNGDAAARDELFAAVLPVLRQIAANALRDDRMRVELDPTELINECAIRMLDLNAMQWEDRVHFFGSAASTMRRILIDRARALAAGKRDGVEVTLAGVAGQHFMPDAELLDVDAALTRLADISADRAEVVELRFFGGLTNDEVAAYLGVSEATTKRRWRAARAWLRDALS
ncbi:MAG: ECF-type sigma factor [bacterium]